MGIIINYLKKNKIKQRKKYKNFFQKNYKNKKLKTKITTKNSKLKAQNKNKNKKPPQNKNKNSKPKKSKKKQRRTHLSSTSPKICSRCPNFKKKEKHNCHFFETLKEVPIS